MHNLYKWFLPLPILIILLGGYLLLTGEAYIKKRSWSVPETQSSSTTQSGQQRRENKLPIETEIVPDTFSDDLKVNRESAYSYFLLGAGLLIALGVLPRLSQLSLLPTGITLQLLHEVQDTVAEVLVTAQAVEAKSKENAGAPGLLKSQNPDLTQEINKLETNRLKLEAYTTMLRKITTGRNKT
ncbi:MAG: hypothetical protein COW65_13985 [Cytophagales bacterium CG18_big_fil_WC_8_21_14_2_50_42_9]|nr:MAG: hypothetical protein COW65_13985 [Cytophagales bacterium CG18_big_fil_WC_8_21_14_2_50_42_9]